QIITLSNCQISKFSHIFPLTKDHYMKRMLLLFLSILLAIIGLESHAQGNKADTVKTGIYITSIHDIDFKQKEYTITFWVWFKYKNKDFDFTKNLEVPQAKTVDKSFSVVDSSDGKMFVEMKLQCVMKDSWKITNFPYDHQSLRLSIEN